MEKIAIITGDVSGDIYGANLIKEIKNIKPNIKFFGLGGENITKTGAEIIDDLTKYSLIGFFEVIKYLPKLNKIMKKIIRKIEIEKPNCIILIDNPGFNMKLAKKVHHLNIPIIYFIPPQVWAWGKNRIKKIKKYIDKVIVPLPFEENIYKEYGIDVKFFIYIFFKR
jgi:lipid-A-disaccharide synthase